MFSNASIMVQTTGGAVAVAFAVGVGDGVGLGFGIGVGVGVGVGAEIHCPRRIETVFEPLLATAKSCLPSPLKSPIVIATGTEPTVTLVEPLKPPRPSPRRIETVFE